MCLTHVHKMHISKLFKSNLNLFNYQFLVYKKVMHDSIARKPLPFIIYLFLFYSNMNDLCFLYSMLWTQCFSSFSTHFYATNWCLAVFVDFCLFRAVNCSFFFKCYLQSFKEKYYCLIEMIDSCHYYLKNPVIDCLHSCKI